MLWSTYDTRRTRSVNGSDSCRARRTRSSCEIPIGFAHGLLSLSNPADVLYRATDYYAPECERSIRWDDPTIGIDWPGVGIAPILADKDARAPFLQDAETFD